MAADIRKNDYGTFHRAGRKTAHAAEWNHKRDKGAVSLKHGDDETVTAQVRWPDQEWQMLSAFLRRLNRHVGDQVTASTSSLCDAVRHPGGAPTK